eukprot:15443476-Alexandrium_andersonii.AAC.1
MCSAATKFAAYRRQVENQSTTQRQFGRLRRSRSGPSVSQRAHGTAPSCGFGHAATGLSAHMVSATQPAG